MAGEILNKQPSESDIYDIDFAPVLRAGDNIDSVTSVTTTQSGLVIGSPAKSGQKVQVQISSGTDGTLYKLTAIIVSVAGHIKELDVLLRVEDG